MVGDIYVSFFVDVSSGASGVLVSALLFVLALIYTQIKNGMSLPRRTAVRPVASLASPNLTE